MDLFRKVQMQQSMGGNVAVVKKTRKGAKGAKGAKASRKSPGGARGAMGPIAEDGGDGGGGAWGDASDLYTSPPVKARVAAQQKERGVRGVRGKCLLNRCYVTTWYSSIGTLVSSLYI